jgi:hypothetical protein
MAIPLPPMIPPLDLLPGADKVNDVLAGDTTERIPASQLIQQETGWRGNNAIIARAVMGGESSYNPDAANACCVGLMQVNASVHKGKFGMPSDEQEARQWLRDPRNNLRAAYKVWLLQGWDAWEAYTNGSWRQHRGADPLITVRTKRTGTGAVVGAAGDVVDAALGPVDEIAGALLNPSTWLRIGKGVGGMVLIVMGVGGLVFVVASKSNTGKSLKSTAIGAAKAKVPIK